jgi:hypothetical protein
VSGQDRAQLVEIDGLGQRRAMSADHRLESAWFGQSAAIKEKALDQALLMIS